jgi:hypothetical protein
MTTTTARQDVISRLKQPQQIQTLIHLAAFVILSACSPLLSRVSLLCLLNLAMMSLVGQEVDIRKKRKQPLGGDVDDDDIMNTSDYSMLRDENQNEYDHAGVPEDAHPLGNDNSPTLLPGEGVEDVHLPASPAGPAERLFFMDMLQTDNISAAALAQQIHQSHRSFMASVASIATANTDDFVSARAGESRLSDHADADFDDIADQHENYYRSNDDGLTPFDFDDTPADENIQSPFDTDVLAFTNNARSKSLPNQPETEFHDTTENMSSSANETTMHADPAEKAYDAAKNVWAWGKGVFVLKPFLGMAEGAAGKFVSMTGSSLEDLDHKIMPRLQEWDDSLLNPAIQALVNVIMGAVSKSEDIFKPVVMAVLKPIGLIKDDKKKKSGSEPENTPKPTMVK